MWEVHNTYTPQQHAQIHKYAEETGLLCILQLLVRGVNPSHCCTTMQIITTCNKVGNLQFGDPTPECQIANLIPCQFFFPYSICPVCGMWYVVFNMLQYLVVQHLLPHLLSLTLVDG